MGDPKIESQVGRVDGNFPKDPSPDRKLVSRCTSASSGTCVVQTKKNSLALTQKKPSNNLVIGQMYDHHIYDLVEVGVENFRSMESFSYDKKIAPVVGSKPYIVSVGEGFEKVEELQHLKKVLLDLLRGEVFPQKTGTFSVFGYSSKSSENLKKRGNLCSAGCGELDRAYICTAVSSNRVFFTNCALRLKKSGTIIPKTELVAVGPSMDLVIRRHHLPNDSLRKEAMKTGIDKPKKKEKNAGQDAVQGKIGKIYIPGQKVGEMKLPNKARGVERPARDGNRPATKKQ